MSTASKIAIWALVVVTAGLLVLHAVGVVGIAEGNNEQILFSGFAALNALSLIVILIPVRRGEAWGWAANWLQVVALALVTVFAEEKSLGYTYAAFAAVLALCLLVARPRSL